MNMSKEKFNITRVVTKDIITDSFQGIRNLFGLRLRSYEAMIKDAYKEIIEEMRLRYDDEVKWYRISFNPLSKESVMINLYGVLK